MQEKTPWKPESAQINAANLTDCLSLCSAS